MYKMLNGLTFPKLVFIKEAEKGNIFKLDWTNKEKSIKNNYINWLKQYHQNFYSNEITKGDFYIEQFPISFNDILKNTYFKLSNSYLDEIRKQTANAMVEWSSHYPFDTVVREMCLQPAIMHVKIAFYLLKDCICDINGKFIHDNYFSKIAMYVMLYKFWGGQTGRGCVKEHAFLIELKNLLSFYEKNDKKLYDYILIFLTAIDKVENEIEKNYPTIKDN